MCLLSLITPDHKACQMQGIIIYIQEILAYIAYINKVLFWILIYFLFFSK